MVLWLARESLLCRKRWFSAAARETSQSVEFVSQSYVSKPTRVRMLPRARSWPEYAKCDSGFHRVLQVKSAEHRFQIHSLLVATLLMSRPSLLAITDSELVRWLKASGQPRFRAKQIIQALYREKVADVTEIQTLPKALRQQLGEAFSLFDADALRHQKSVDGTEKLLLRLDDSETVETVLMRETSRRTVCVSTQVGCAMGCIFCASGLLGVKRNLTTAEILEQVFRVDRLLPPDEKLTNVVVMGLGEPMANLRQLKPALDVLIDPDRYALSPRRITVSTVGLPDKMREFASWGKPFNLAVSLHAPNDDLRTEIVPVNKSTGIEAILEAAEHYFETTGRRVTYEYVLLAGRNDQPHHASQLAKLMRGRNAHINLIPMNPVEPTGLDAPSMPATQAFADVLTKNGINVTVRKRKGADIDAACGQLRLKNEPVELVAT